MFDTAKNSLRKFKKNNQTQRVIIVSASVAALIASGDSTTNSTPFISGDVSGSASNGNDTITIGSNGGIVNAAAGDDVISGGDTADTIMGGAGVDITTGGGGIDNLVVIGITIDAGYTQADLLNIAGTGVNLDALLDLSFINNHSVSDVEPGESIDGGADGAILFTLGEVDFKGVSLNNISKIYLDGEITLSNAALQSLISQGLTNLLGDGTIKAETGLLDLDGVNVPAAVTIKDADGNIILPTFTSDESVNIAENTSAVGTFSVSDASAVGEVIYQISGIDSALFDINSLTGDVSFKSAIDFENPLDDGADNVYNITVTATDEHQKSTNQNIAINVIDDSSTADAAPYLTASSMLKYGAESTVNSLTSNVQQDSSVAALANGGYIVVWDTKNQDDDNNIEFNMHAQRYDNSGTALGDEFLINSTTDRSQQKARVIGLNDGGFVVVWQSYIDTSGPEPFEIRGRKFNDSGVADDVEFQVNVGDYFVSTPSIASLADGGFVITWNSYEQDGDNTGVVSRIFNADGSAQTDDIIVNTYTESAQSAGKVTPLTNGGYIVAWNSWMQDGSRMGSYFQKFNSDGIANGEETQINLTTEHYQGSVTIAALGGGGFAAVWVDNNASGSDTGTYDVKGNIYAEDGTLILSELLINQYTVDSQKTPAITVLSDGSFVVTWVSNGQDGDGGGIYGRHFAVNGTALNDEFLINSTTADGQDEVAITALDNGGFVVSWTGDSNSNSDIFNQVFSHNDYRFEAENSYDFDIFAALPYGQTGFTLTDVTISGISDGVSFTDDNGDAVGTLNGDTLTLTQAQLVGLKVKLSSEFSSDVDLILSVTSENLVDLQAESKLTMTLNLVHPPEFDNNEIGVLSISEQNTIVGSVLAINPKNQSLSYSLSGADAHLFNVNSTTGELSLNTAEDFEDPTQSDNQYDLTIIAVDSEGLSDTKTVVVNVNDIDEAPQFYADDTYVTYMPSDRTDVATLHATDPENNTIAYSLALGGDNDLFTIDSGGKINFITQPEFDNPTDVGTDNIYDISVTATANGKTDSRDVEIHLTNYKAPSLFVNNEMTPTGAEISLSTEHNYSQEDVAVTSLSDGSFVATWTFNGEDGVDDQAGIYGQKYSKDGVKIGDEFHINSYTVNTQKEPDITALENGAFVVVWSSYHQAEAGSSKEDVYGQMFDGSGTTNGGEFLINTITDAVQKNANVASLSNGGFVVVWNGRDSGGKGILGQKYDASGATDGDEFIINTTELNKQEFPDVIGLSSGGFAVVWQSTNQDTSGLGIYGQKFDAAGDADGVEFLVNTYVTNSQSFASFTALADDGFVVVWSSSNQDTSNAGIYGQMYDANGTVGSEFLINSEIESIQDDPDVTAQADGGFVVTWNSYAQDGDAYGVFGQRYDQAGTTVGTEFQINSTKNGNQQDSSITATQDGGFIVTWSGYNADTLEYNVYGQIFETAPIYKMAVNSSSDFDIMALVQSDQDDVLGNVTISGISAGISFTDGNGDAVGLSLDDTLTLTQAQLDGLQIKSAGGSFGITELTLSVSSLDNTTSAVNATTSQISIAIGGTESADAGADSFIIFSTNKFYNIDGLGGRDSLIMISDIVPNYSFETIGNDILMSKASGDGFLLHSVEKINDGNSNDFDFANLYSDMTTDMTEAEYNIWLTNSFDYDIA